MANAVWPPGLPQDQFIGLSWALVPAVLRTDVDGGPAKVRRRFTSSYQRVATPIILNNAQAQTLRSFYVSTLADGALPFDWEDPADNSIVAMRFVTPPSLDMAGTNANGPYWSGTMDLEILPDES